MNSPSRLITIQVKSKAREPLVKESADGTLIVSVHEAAADGKANEAVIKAIAEHLNIPPSLVTIVRGLKSRRKLIRIG